MNAGDIILVKFPFTNLTSDKKRPALVIGVVPFGQSEFLITVAMITSQIEAIQLQGDVILKDWKNAQLLHPSLVRLSKVATIESQLVDKALGVLSSKDQKEVQSHFKKLYQYWLKN